MDKRGYRNNGRHGKFGKDVETVVVSRRVPKLYAEKASAMFDEIILEIIMRTTMEETIQLIWEKWPRAERFCEDKDLPNPMFDVCMVLPDKKGGILYLSVGNLTGMKIQPLILKDPTRLSYYKKIWRHRVSLGDFNDEVNYGSQYRIGRSTFCIAPNGQEFPLEDFKKEIETWYSRECGDE